MKKNLVRILTIMLIIALGVTAAATPSTPTNTPTATTETTLQIEIMNNDFDIAYQLFQTLGVHAVIHNKGLINATQVQWSITLNGGIILLGKKASGVIPVMFPDQSIIVSIPFVSGLGTTTINASVSASNANQTIEIKQGKMKGLNVQILPGTNGATTIHLDKIVGGLKSPLLLTHADDGSGRLFVVEQRGQIRIIKNGQLLSTPFLDVSSKMIKINPLYDERGLLGLAFHPDYKNNGRFFIYYSAPTTTTGMDHQNIIAEYRVDPLDSDKADPASEIKLLSIDYPQANHDGGQLAFGPDGMLYIGVGDGGGEGDQHGTTGNGQNTNTSLGKVLRIDVDHGQPYAIPPDNPFASGNGTKEIYAYGFRNPYRFSFDNATGRLFVADVGQDKWEEIDLVENGKNYGWRIMEGDHLYDPALAQTMHMNISDLTPPLYDYSHYIGHAIIGGYVYRGSQSPTLQGKYIYGDFTDTFFQPRGNIFYLEQTSPNTWKHEEFKLQPNKPLHRYIQAIGQDEAGELYLLTTHIPGSLLKDGEVYHIVGV
jgi:glucose/arabinose dehydrogenase